MPAVRGFACFALGALLLVSAGCRTSGLAFRADQRVEITAPENRSEVTLPFDLTWSVEDFDVVGSDGSNRSDAGFFAVLLDTSPMPPGEGPSYYARDDENCTAETRCPDVQYLADRNVFLTRDTTFPVTALQDFRPIDRPSARDDHEIAIVLLNGQNRRIGESVFKVEVTVDRGDT